MKPRDKGRHHGNFRQGQIHARYMKFLDMMDSHQYSDGEHLMFNGWPAPCKGRPKNYRQKLNNRRKRKH